MKKIAYWLPARTGMTSVDYDNPGYLLEEVRNGLVHCIEKHTGIELINVEDFRTGYIKSGRAIINGLTEKTDAFVWFGEIGRDATMEYNLELLKTIETDTNVMNCTRGYETVMDKFKTSSFLKSKGIEVPEFALVNATNIENAEELLSSWTDGVLLKPRSGSYGIGITKINSSDELTNIIDYSGKSNHFIERFIPNSPEEWIGINIIGGEYAYSYRKGADSYQGGWKVMDRNKKGGKMIVAEPNDNQLKTTKKIAKELDLNWVGIDMITGSDGKEYVIDVNAFPGIYPEIYTKIGVDCPKMMCDSIIEKIEGGL